MTKQRAIKIVIGIICAGTFMSERVTGDQTGGCGLVVNSSLNLCTSDYDCIDYWVKTPVDQACWGPGVNYCLDDGFGYAINVEYVGGSCSSGSCVSGKWFTQTIGSYTKKKTGGSCIGG